MANLWVVVTGLAVLVERLGNSTKPYVALLRDVGPNTRVPDNADGKIIPEHHPRLKLLPDGEEIPIVGKDVEFLPQGSGNPGIDDPEPFLRVGRELTEGMEVLPTFLGQQIPDGWARLCLAGGGDAAIYPIHVMKDFELKTISTTPILKLEKALDLEQKTSKVKKKPRVGNGLLYYRHIPSGDPSVDIQPGSDPGPWTPVHPADAEELPHRNQEHDYVVWISNAGDDLYEKGVDRDFYLLYELLGVPPPVTRYVPVISIPEPVTNPPGQCMIGYALGEK